MIAVGKKGERYPPWFQFQVVVEVLKEDGEAVEIAWAHNLRPTMVARWKKELLENGAQVSGKGRTVVEYERTTQFGERGPLSN